MPYLVPFLTAEEVLTRALDVIERPLPHEWANCQYDLGPYCARCACARAATELRVEQDLRFDAADDALTYAGTLIRAAGDDGERPLGVDEARAVLRRALTNR